MAKLIKLSDKELVTNHIQKLDASISGIVENIRQIILSTDPNISEKIKWNNPSFYYAGPMQPFDPKEYKSEIAVMNLFKNRLMLVFPSGAKINIHNDILEGNYTDGRRLVVFKDLDDVLNKKVILQSVIKEWIRLVK
jgi:hypothetical protein